MRPRSSRGVRSAAFPAQNPNLQTNMWIEGIRGRETACSHAPIRNPPIRNPHNPWPFAREKRR
eukprot:3535750-Alexandrium_andersonii.AAC.1